jgi:hypothetical protein
VLDAEESKLRTKFHGDLNQSLTQIVLFRLPTIASDLFGLGALAYDLVRGGRSSERFYVIFMSLYFAGCPASSAGQRNCAAGTMLQCAPQSRLCNR